MTYNPPYLQPYQGKASRHECPACHDKHSFSYYLDGNTGEVIDRKVGKCGREVKCKYHYTPKQFFADNPDHKAAAVSSRPPQRSEPPKEAGRISKEYAIRALGYNSNFVAFLCSLFDLDTLESPTIVRLMGDYYLGAAKDKSVIFWQIGHDKRLCTGKIMQYNPETGKRVKDKPGIDWVHSKLKKEGALPEDFNLVQCLFGEHLLKRYPEKIVALVESEKSAIIGAGVYPAYVWLATGGRSQLSIDKLRVLRGRTIIMFPDTDTDGTTYALWHEKGRELEKIGCKVMVSEVLEKNALQADKEAKIDIADWLIRELRASAPKSAPPPLTTEQKALRHLANLNPHIYTLIDSLDLVSGSTGEKICKVD